MDECKQAGQKARPVIVVYSILLDKADVLWRPV
jgi:hypothetical protein